MPKLGEIHSAQISPPHSLHFHTKILKLIDGTYGNRTICAIIDLSYKQLN